MPGTERNQSHLIKWGLDEYLNPTLNKFRVTKCSIEVVNDGLDSKISLEISIKRLSGPIWMSLFIPSMCLILAAELTLIMDESHFDSLIMVALTSSLVMYTLYDGIHEKLPDNSSFKLIDVWLIHGLLFPILVFVVLSANELINSQSTKEMLLSRSIKVSNSAVQAPSNLNITASNRKVKIFMVICKIAIPTISVIFIPTFFGLMLIHQAQFA